MQNQFLSWKVMVLSGTITFKWLKGGFFFLVSGKSDAEEYFAIQNSMIRSNWENFLFKEPLKNSEGGKEMDHNCFLIGVPHWSIRNKNLKNWKNKGLQILRSGSDLLSWDTKSRLNGKTSETIVTLLELKDEYWEYS